MIVSKRFLRFSGLLVWLGSLGAVAFFPASTALAASRDNGYTFTLTESTSSMYYGNLSPTFQAFLTVPANEPPMPADGINVVVDGGLTIGGTITGSAPNYTLTVPGATWRFLPGPHTVVAQYLSVPLNQYIYSQQLTFNVNKGNATLRCDIANYLTYGTNTYAANAPLQMNFIVHNSYTGGNLDVDVQNATYTVIFVGAKTFTYANIRPPAPNFNFEIIQGPSVPGHYAMRCIFNGTGLFSSTEADTDVTLLSTSSSPTPTPTPTPANQQPGPGSTTTPAASTHTHTSTATATSAVMATATAISGLVPANTTPPPSSNSSTVLLWALAAVVVCSGAGGLGFLFWRKRKLPVSL
jgi:hypothetical protein